MPNQTMQPTPKAFARRGGQAEQARWPNIWVSSWL
jgi:hypothetical protein